MTKRLKVKGEADNIKIQRRIVRVRQTLWRWEMVAPQVPPAVTLVIIASSVISGSGEIFIISWLDRLFFFLWMEEKRGYLWTKEVNITAPNGHLCWVGSLLNFLRMRFLALVSKVMSRTLNLAADREFIKLCLLSCGIAYISRSPHLLPFLPTHPLTISSHDCKFGATVWDTALWATVA